MYDDDYATCSKTYATLRVYVVDPDEVTERLGLAPTSVQRKGDLMTSGQRWPLNGWFLTSRGAVDSKDSRRHLDWLLDQLLSRRESLASLISDGARADIFCFWLSIGHGGPTVSPEQARKLNDLELDLGFDVYFDKHTADQPSQ
jgi:hypothetical protein